MMPFNLAEKTTVHKTSIISEAQTICGTNKVLLLKSAHNCCCLQILFPHFLHAHTPFPLLFGATCCSSKSHVAEIR